MLTVQLGAGVDSYPGVSSARKVKQEERLPGEKEVIRACLDYAYKKWDEGIAAVNSVDFNVAQEEWRVSIGNVYNDSSLTLMVKKDKEITEA